MVWIGRGAPAICRPDDGAVFSAGVAFAAAAGEGEARPVLVPGGGDPFGGDEAGEAIGDAAAALAGDPAEAGEAADGGL